MNSLINELLEKIEGITEEKKIEKSTNNFELYDAFERVESSLKYYEKVRMKQISNR